MHATPAGNEMNVRTIGSSRLKNAVVGALPPVEEVLGEPPISWPIRMYLP